MFRHIHLLIILFLLNGFSCYSQEKPKVNVYEVLKDNELSEWHKTRKAWEDKYFFAFLKKHKIKFSCASCSSVYIDIDVEVMDDGHAHIKVTDTKKCGSQFNAKQITELEKLFFNMQFAPELNAKKFIARVGNGLKC